MINGRFVEKLPNNIKEKYQSNEGLRNIIGNINWLTLETIGRNLVGIVIFAWIARYLGPEKFGMMSYASAFVTLFSAFSTLGLDDVIVRNLVSDKENRYSYLGGTLILKFFGSLVMLVVSGITIFILEKGNSDTTIFVLILAGGYVFKSLDVIDLWFKSQVQSQYSVYARTISFIITSILKIALILLNAPLIAFIIVTTLDLLLTAIFLLYLYYKKNNISLSKWVYRYDVTKNLLRDCWPLFFSAIATLIYMKIDQIMIEQMLGDKELGLYSSAVKLSEAWYFIPSVIMTSVFPAIINAKRKSRELYLQRMQVMYDFFTWLTISIAILVSIFSPLIIKILYGDQYMPSASVLALHIWAGLPVFLGVASGKFLISENFTKVSLIRTVVGAIVNVGLNIFIIPSMGIMGAALSTLLSYAVATFFILLIPSCRDASLGLIRSFNIFGVVKRLKSNIFPKNE